MVDYAIKPNPTKSNQINSSHIYKRLWQKIDFFKMIFFQRFIRDLIPSFLKCLKLIEKTHRFLFIH